MFRDNDGLLRSKGRLDYAEMDVDQKMPMVLSRDHRYHVTRFIIEDVHEKVSHC